MVFKCINQGNMEKKNGLAELLTLKIMGFFMKLKLRADQILVLFGKTTNGVFVCMPDFGAGCYLVDPRRSVLEYRTTNRVLGKIDGITVVAALKALPDKINY